MSRNGAQLKEIDGRVSQLFEELAALLALTSKVESKISTSMPPIASFAEVTKSLANSDSGTHGRMPGGSQISTSTRPSRFARSENLIIFGLPEVDSLPDLKNSVDELLSFLVGKPIPISDMYRLGRRKVLTVASVTPRPRPVILKLLSPCTAKKMVVFIH